MPDKCIINKWYIDRNKTVALTRKFVRLQFTGCNVITKFPKYQENGTTTKNRHIDSTPLNNTYKIDYNKMSKFEFRNVKKC